MLNASLLKQPIHWIENEIQLREACESWQDCKLLSVDTEFMRSRTYFPIAGLFQVNDAKANYLIDPTSFEDFSAFKEVLLDPSVVKVLHSCSEDLEVFHKSLGILPVNLLDTQIAAAMLGYGFSVGFGNLCQSLFGIELPKSETRSNWLQRPLSDSQIQYAAIDVEYLTAIAVRLIKEAQSTNRLGWIKEECEKLSANFYETQDIQLAWQRGKTAWKLDPRELLRFQYLSRWREQKARQRDVPRNRVIKDHTLIELAQQVPTELKELKKFEGVNERIVRSDGQDLLDLLESANQSDSEALPKRLPRPLSSSAKEKIKHLRALVQEKAELLNISPELLVRKKDYEDLLRASDEAAGDGEEWQLPSALKDWRHGLVGELLMNEVKKL